MLRAQVDMGLQRFLGVQRCFLHGRAGAGAAGQIEKKHAEPIGGLFDDGRKIARHVVYAFLA